MKCLICNEEINELRSIKNFFCLKAQRVCKRCKKRYVIDINFQVIPLDKKDIHIYSLLKEDYFLDYEAFVDSMHQLLSKICELAEDNIVLFFDKIYVDERFITNMKVLEDLTDDYLIIVCYYA